MNSLPGSKKLHFIPPLLLICSASIVIFCLMAAESVSSLAGIRRITPKAVLKSFVSIDILASSPQKTLSIKAEIISTKVFFRG